MKDRILRTWFLISCCWTSCACLRNRPPRTFCSPNARTIDAPRIASCSITFASASDSIFFPECFCIARTTRSKMTTEIGIEAHTTKVSFGLIRDMNRSPPMSWSGRCR